MKTKFSLITSCLSFFLIINIHAQDPTFEWARQMGGTNYNFGFSITTDADGDIYTTGTFEGTVDFDPGAGATHLTSNGQQDIFIQKIDQDGNLLWVKNMGGKWQEVVSSIAVDINGNVYTTGSFNSTVDFDPGIGTANLTGYEDIFIQKLDNNGNLLWVKQIEGTSTSYGQSINTDTEGNVFVTGYFYGTSDFDPDIGIMNFSSRGSNSSDIYILKLNASGNLIWVKQIGGTMNEFAFSTTIDSSGNIYTTGCFQGTVDFDPGPGTTNLVAIGNHDIFIQKLDKLGNLLWVKQMGGTNTNYGYSITVDKWENVYTTGYFTETVDFDPDVDTNNYTSNGSHDIFIQKLDANGNLMWANQMGGSSWDQGHSISTDTYGNVYTTGYFNQTVDFDASAGIMNFTSNGSHDIFIQKLNTNGNLLWSKQIGGTRFDSGNSITIHSNETIYVTGNFEDTVDFDLSTGTTSFITNGTSDIFILKLNQCQVFDTVVQTSCDSYTWIDGITYTASTNTPTFTMKSQLGCDSIISLDLTINNSSLTTDKITACNSFTWIDGITYTSTTNTPTFTLTNQSGCDSVVTLNLTIYNNSETDIISACDSYTWIDGNTYTSSNNVAIYILPGTNGCDSIIELDLTIHDIPDTSITVNDLTITANNSNATYQWLDCDNEFSIIANETGQSLTATTDGNYAVELTENDCIDTSACIFLNVENDNIYIYPNPTKGKFTIEFGKNQESFSLRIYNSIGQLIQVKSYLNTQKTEVELNEPKGVYLIEIRNEEGQKAIIRLVKN